jgi:D-alanine transaminase/branched-chain amino acid aminotransferase
MDYPIYHNNSWVPAEKAFVPMKDLGFLRGYGIFDFFRIMNGRPIFLSDHLDRFLSSASKMGIQHSYTKDMLSQLILGLASTAQDPCLGVKMILTGGLSLDGFNPSGTANLYILPAVFSFADPERGMHLKSYDFQREMADIKSLNYAFAIRHWAEVKAQACDDVLFYTEAHGVSEASRSNLFFVKNQVIHTPSHFILEGITRKHVLALAEKQYEIRVGSYSLGDFLSADEVFTTGSTKRVLPIFSIDQQPIHQGTRGPVTKHLYDMLVSHEG